MFPAMSVSKSVSAYSPSSSSKLKITSVVVAAAVTSDNAITKTGAAFLMQISAFIVFPSTFELMFELAGPERAKNLVVDKSPPDSDPLSVAEYGKSFRVCQNNSSQVKIADSSRTKQLPSLPAYSLPACSKFVSD